ncbi:plasmid partitioning protein RepB [Chelatococcus sp. HY11]|uniref:plasmid partitioning protein RepB n=1 Tax=Chelatococcus sp. HY11 TaxID=2835634 RepID=UPI001BCE0B1D|nr:plasmid partitioning protein RepB [Chelatococcus sp. HY11]MBS7743555.1 plasmid partitioning protein RepB [Chelatococcus sp. HY11]CAH1664035.1 ParB family chromosome partitioning protein [Hyphomicrobiales bacterium]CAH1688048.1 ParB family chromosome partitioning protein [Hyphomicrobiales bacterium]
MSRKDTLKAMLTRRAAELPHGNSVQVDQSNTSSLDSGRSRSAAVGAMSRSLGEIANAAERARALVSAGAAVIEIPPENLVDSFAQDRLHDEGEEFETLLRAIETSGQKSPILVRPLPDRPDKYQIAYGHRRAKILAKLGRPVRAVVQTLSDEELVVIQGQENSARKDLSYIERGLFAITLEEQGFDRSIIMSALSMEKTQLSRLLTLTKSIPKSLILAIGPAPKAGRPRWTAFAERLGNMKNNVSLDDLLNDPLFQSADSDLRFVKAFARLAPDRTKSETANVDVKSDSGEKIATIEPARRTISFVGGTDGGSAFAEFVAENLPSLYRTFRNREASDNL